MIKKKLYAINFKSIVCLFKRSLQEMITTKECITVVIFLTCQVKIIAIFKLQPQKAKHKHTFKKKRKYIFKWEGAKIILLHASHERPPAHTHTHTVCTLYNFYVSPYVIHYQIPLHVSQISYFGQLIIKLLKTSLFVIQKV